MTSIWMHPLPGASPCRLSTSRTRRLAQFIIRPDGKPITGERLASLLRPRLGAGSTAARRTSCRRGCRRPRQAQAPLKRRPSASRPRDSRKTYRRRRPCRSPRPAAPALEITLRLRRQATPSLPSVTITVARSCSDSARPAPRSSRRDAERFGDQRAFALVHDEMGRVRDQPERVVAKRREVQEHARAGCSRPSRRGCHRREPAPRAAAGGRRPARNSSASASASPTAPFAPGMTAMTFSPPASTRISATPVGPSTARTRERSTPPPRAAPAQAREIVRSDRADHADRAPGARGGERLIGALAAGRGRRTRCPAPSRPAAAAARHCRSDRD